MSAAQAQVVVVTGAGSGIGAGTADLLAARGAYIIVADREAAAATAQTDKIRVAGGSADAVTLDVTDVEAARALFDELSAKGRVVTGLVNSAGIAIRAPFAEIDIEHWRRVIDVNLTGTMIMSQAFVRHVMTAARPGAIVNVASVMGHFGAPNLSPYAASKGGVGMLTRTLAVELAPQGIRVNAVSPGYIVTAMTGKVFRVPRFAKAVLGRTPMGRFGVPLDIARVVAFLLSEDAGYVTGQVLPVDGGMTAGDLALASPSPDELSAALDAE